MIAMEPIGHVQGARAAPDDDWCGGSEARIVLAEGYPAEALLGIEEFSHAEVLYCFDQVAPESVVRGARHPRGNQAWPKVGIFAQRGKNRPNRLGLCSCRILRVDGLTIEVEGLDALDGTPVLDLKPVMTGFLPRGEIREPAWAREIMDAYW